MKHEAATAAKSSLRSPRFIGHSVRMRQIGGMASFQIRSLLRNGIAALCAVSLCAPPAQAQSVLRDAETEAFFDEISRPIIAASGLDPANVDIVLINDKSVNAFVAGGQTVYIHSGLINTASTANEVQGVIAHELGHIEGGHVIRYGDGMKAASGISIASLVLAAAAIAAGAAEAGMAIMQAGQRAAIGKFLAFSRVQESVADASGARYLVKSRDYRARFGELFQKAAKPRIPPRHPARG